MDRRVQQTHSKLVAALRTLMQQHPYESISVATICAQANVSRSSYYTHFAGKQALFDLSLQFLATELIATDSERSLDATNSFAFLPGFLAHIQSHRMIYVENRFSQGLPAIMRNIKSIAHGLAQNELVKSAQGEKCSEHQLRFVIGGVYALVEEWIDDNCSQSASALVICLDELITLGLGLQRS